MTDQGREVQSRFARWRERRRLKRVEKGLREMAADDHRIRSTAADDQHWKPRDYGSAGGAGGAGGGGG
jgi:hypothetical protein